MSNPFNYGRVVTKGDFFNREQEQIELIADIKSGNSNWLYSPRRYGKTSLVKQTFLGMKDVKTIYFDLYGIIDTKDFLTRYITLLTRELMNWKIGVKKITNQISSYVKGFSPSVNFDIYGNPTIVLNSSGNIEDQDWQSILNFPELIKYSKPICIAFDEFQEITRINPHLINAMRSVFQHQQNVSYIFLGSKDSLMHSIFADIKSPFYQFGKKTVINPIEVGSFAKFLTDKFKQSGFPVSKKTVSEILALTKGRPYYTQFTAAIVWNIRFQNPDLKEIPVDVWQEKLLSGQVAVFQTMFDQLNNNQRNVLHAIAAEPDEIKLYSDEVRVKYRLPASSTISITLKSLISKGHLLKNVKEYSFENPIFQLWIKNLYNRY